MTETKTHSSRLLIAGFIAAFATFAGCSDNRPMTVPITGSVTIDGKPPGESGNIYFTVIQPAEGYPRRPASGAFDVDGVYRVMSWAPDDGLVPGHYTVSVVPGDASKTVIPKKYHQSKTSGLEVDISPDKDEIEYNIDVRSK
jgi:hypothetical protein